jgi:hypothetical protein
VARSCPLASTLNVRHPASNVESTLRNVIPCHRTSMIQSKFSLQDPGDHSQVESRRYVLRFSDNAREDLGVFSR